MGTKNIFVGRAAEKAWKLLLRTKNILEKKGIPFWLESGSLLGFYREKKILPYAKNLNIGIPSDYFDKLRKLETLFWPRYRFSIRYDISGRQWINANYSHILIRPVIKTRTFCFSLKITPKDIGDAETKWVERIVCKQAESIHFKNLQSLTINGETFPIPGNTKHYLTHRYGNWESVETDWNTYRSDGAILEEERFKCLPLKTRWTRPKRYKRQIRMEGRTLKNAKRMIKDTITILEKHNIRYWIDMGTLLGIIRDNELIPWDHDVDIAVDGADAYKLLKISKAFFPFYRIKPTYDHTGRLPKPLRAFRIKPTSEKVSLLLGIKELHMDMYIKYKVEDSYYWIDSFTLKKVDSKYYDKLDTIEWDNHTYRIPSDVETYLSNRYRNWRTPVQKFDSSLDDLAKAD